MDFLAYYKARVATHFSSQLAKPAFALPHSIFNYPIDLEPRQIQLQTVFSFLSLVFLLRSASPSNANIVLQNVIIIL